MNSIYAIQNVDFIEEFHNFRLGRNPRDFLCANQICWIIVEWSRLFLFVCRRRRWITANIDNFIDSCSIDFDVASCNAMEKEENWVQFISRKPNIKFTFREAISDRTFCIFVNRFATRIRCLSKTKHYQIERCSEINWIFSPYLIFCSIHFDIGHSIGLSCLLFIIIDIAIDIAIDDCLLLWLMCVHVSL